MGIQKRLVVLLMSAELMLGACSRIGFDYQAPDPFTDPSSGSGNGNGNNNVGSGHGNDNGNGIAIDTSALTSKLYWLEEGAVKRANLDGTGIETLVTVAVEHPDSLVLDIPANQLYWTDDGNNTIRRATLDGTQAELLAASPLAEDPHGLALDHAAGRLYWGDHTKDRLQWIQLDKPTQMEADDTFGCDDDDVMALTLDPRTRSLFVLNNCPKALHELDVDTDDKKVNLRDHLDNPVGLALDAAAGHLYYTERNKITRCNLDGTDAQTLISTPGRQNGIALDLTNGKIYWTEANSKKIQRANLDGTEVEDVLATGNNPQGLALDLRASF